MSVAVGVLVALALAAVVPALAAPANPFAPPEPKNEEPAAPAGQGGPAKGETVQEHTFQAPPAEVRAVRGRLTPPDRVKEAYLVERMLDIKVPVPVDAETGRFEVTDLRMGTYCFVIRTPWGRLEGVDLTPRLSPYDALIPPRYRIEAIGLPAKGEFTDQDRAAVRRIIHKVKRYENKVTDMVISASGETAVALVELLMDAPFHGRKGDEVTWRIEKWYYDKLYDAWNTFRSQCLYRLRASKAEWQTWGWQFEPKLGGLDITYGMEGPVEVKYAIPAEPTREKGLAGSKYPPADKGRTW
ncbi:MAG: hypothetical protein U9R68_09290 [Planctomycetota bacterium]|nr:hypothetical protein [Planctomycetota bacterium]